MMLRSGRNKSSLLPIVLWMIAVTPIILALLAYGMRVWIIKGPNHDGTINTLTVILALISLLMLLTSYAYASGKLDPNTDIVDSTAGQSVTRHTHLKIEAVALPLVPAIFGFVLHVLYGDRITLVLFNLSAFAVALRHVLAFTTADGR
jgi:hypothetical protein